MADIEHLAHLPRWKRVLFWCCGSQAGLSILGVIAVLLLFGPAYWFGWWWMAVVGAGMVGFCAGYNLARSYWLDRGDIPRL